MDSPRWQEIKRIMNVVLELPSDQRSSYLDGLAAKDPELVQEVQSFLMAHDQASDSFLQSAPAPQLGKGTRLGNYEIQSLLGAGGMGEVYRASDLKLHRDVAIKVLPAYLSSDPDRLRRFEQEAMAAAASNHPNILSIYQLATYQGAPYLVSELLEGETLREQINHGPMPVRQALDCAIQIAEGLAAAHDKGIVHRDLKPENLFVTKDGRVKILDFGLAKLVLRRMAAGAKASALGNVTEPGVVMGTNGYMSPEQAEGRDVDVRSDIFSLGCVLYEMLAGRRVFEGKTTPALLAALMRDEPKPLREVRPEFAMPAELERIINKALDKDRDRRYQSASEIRADLQRALSAGPTMPRKRTRNLALAAVTAVLVLVGYAATNRWWRKTMAPPPAERIRLAVLPFQNLSGDASQDFFSSGLTDELITQLGHMNPNRLGVIASASSRIVHDKPISEISQSLDVQYVVEGSVRRSGKQVRIDVQLVQASDATNIWSNSYTRELTDVLRAQAEVSQAVARQIPVNLHLASLPPAPTVNVQAHDAYLKGKFYLDNRSDLGRSAGLFEEAIHNDPNYAAAWVGLSQAYSTLGEAPYNALFPREASRKARAAAQRAVELDPSLAEAHAALGLIAFNFDWDLAAAEREYGLALELDPNNVSAHEWLGLVFMVQGKSKEALEEGRQALDLDPVSPACHGFLAEAYFYAADYDRAIEQAGHILEVHPGLLQARYWLGNAYLQKKMYREAIEQFQLSRIASHDNPMTVMAYGYAQALAGNPVETRSALNTLDAMREKQYVPAIYFAAIYMGLGDHATTMKYLNDAYEERSDRLIYLAVEPIAKPLRSDLEFQKLLHKIGLI